MVKIFSPKDQRPTLLDIWMSYHFELSHLAVDADVSLDIINDMMASLPVSKEDAEKVLAYLSKRYQKDFSFCTVHVVLKRQIENKSEVALLMQQIEAENEAGRRALYDPALGISQHEFMTVKAERSAQQFDALRKKLGDDMAQYVIFGEHQVGTSTSTPEV